MNTKTKTKMKNKMKKTKKMKKIELNKIQRYHTMPLPVFDVEMLVGVLEDKRFGFLDVESVTALFFDPAFFKETYFDALLDLAKQRGQLSEDALQTVVMSDGSTVPWVSFDVITEIADAVIHSALYSPYPVEVEPLLMRCQHIQRCFSQIGLIALLSDTAWIPRNDAA
jgi:hypothetical protein